TVVDLGRQEREVLAHLVRDLDPSGDLLESLGHVLVIGERDSGLLLVLADDPEVASGRRVEVVLNEVRDRRRGQSSRAEPIGDRRALLVGVDDRGVELWLEDPRAGRGDRMRISGGLDASGELTRVEGEVPALPSAESALESLHGVLAESPSLRARGGPVRLVLIGGLAELVEDALRSFGGGDLLVELGDLGALGRDLLVLRMSEETAFVLSLLSDSASLVDDRDSLVLE